MHFFASRLKYSRWVEVTLVARRARRDAGADAGRSSRRLRRRPVGGGLRSAEDGRAAVGPRWRGHGVESDVRRRGARSGPGRRSVLAVSPAGERQRRESRRLGEGLVLQAAALSRSRRICEQQLREWLTEANTVRPSRATACRPPRGSREERARLRPLKIAPADLALRIPVSVGPTGVVMHDGHPYSMPPDAIGLPGTLYLYRDRVRIVAGRFGAEHERQLQPGRRLDPAGASRAARGRGVRQTRAALSAAPAPARSRRRRRWRISRSSRIAARACGFTTSSGCTSSCRRTAMRRCAPPLSAASPSRRSAPSTSRTISAPPVPALPFDDGGPAADDSGPSAAARRPGPGRRRRPQGRSAAEHLDAAEHGGILSPRRRPVMIAADHDLDALFKRLHLANARRVWRDLVQRAERESLVLSRLPRRCWSPKRSRIASRRGSRASRGAPTFRFSRRSTISISRISRPCACSCSARRSRPTSSPRAARSSSRQAGARQDAPGRRDRLPRDPERLRRLLHHRRRADRRSVGGLSRRASSPRPCPTYTHPAVLVVDEVGYLTYGTDAANMLFHVVNERHRRKRAMIFTTNKSLKAWGRVLHDEDLAQAIIDRVLERGRLAAARRSVDPHAARRP